MMEQLHAFLLCVAFGIAGGILYDVLYLLTFPFRSRTVQICTDAIFGVLFAGSYLVFSVLIALPPLRGYLFLGLCVGLFLHRKSLHKMVAFCVEKLYNGYVRMTNRKREQKKCSEKKESRKKKQDASL